MDQTFEGGAVWRAIILVVEVKARTWIHIDQPTLLVLPPEKQRGFDELKELTQTTDEEIMGILGF